ASDLILRVVAAPNPRRPRDRNEKASLAANGRQNSREINEVKVRGGIGKPISRVLGASGRGFEPCRADQSAGFSKVSHFSGKTAPRNDDWLSSQASATAKP
ncbi:MAG: hypothetical protein ABSE69_10375, partial [Roseiarcus sp.]